MSLLDWDDQSSEDETVTLVITFPKGRGCIEQSSLNRWSGLGGFYLRNDEKNFIRGFVAGLQLTDNQKQALLKEYVAVWNKAYRQESNPNRKVNRGYFVATTWLRNGASGFISRRME